jgi:hypothetical protein
MVNPGTSVSVEGVVRPYLTLGLTGTAINFGVFTTGVNIAGTTSALTVSTNAVNGVTLSVYDLNTGLYSAASAHTIPSSSTTLTSSSEGYGINAAGNGLTIAAPYSGTSDAVGGLSPTSATLATATSPVVNVTATITYLASITDLTPAGLYTDSVTYVAVGSF